MVGVPGTFMSICNPPLLSPERTAPCAFNHISHSYNPSFPLITEHSPSVLENPKICAKAQLGDMI
jgi:hypothetical protein